MRVLGYLFAVLFLVAVVVHYFWWIAAAVVVVLAVRAYLRARDAREAEVRRLIEQADRQHAWVCAGDPRGIYGTGS